MAKMVKKQVKQSAVQKAPVMIEASAGARTVTLSSPLSSDIYLASATIFGSLIVAHHRDYDLEKPSEQQLIEKAVTLAKQLKEQIGA